MSGLAPAGDTRFAGIAVVGRGQVKVVPDLATFAIAATATALSAGDAMREASAAMNAMIEAASTAGVAAADRQSTGIQLSSWREREGRPTQYHANQRLRLRLRDVDGAGEVLQRVLSAGGNHAQVDDSGLTVADEEPHVDRARDEAMADARRRAEHLARLAGRPLGPVLAVHEEGAGQPSPSGFRRGYDKAMALSSAESAAPMEAGELVVEVGVLVEFAWAD